MSIQKLRTSILVAVGIGVIAAAGLLAGRLSAGAFPHHMHADLATRFDHVSRALSLTDDQKVKIKAVLKTHSDEVKAQIQASASARAALHNAVMAKPIDESAIRAAAQQVGQTQGDGAVLFAKIRAEIEPVLTADQKDRIQKFQERMRQHGQTAAQSFDKFVNSGS